MLCLIKEQKWVLEAGGPAALPAETPFLASSSFWWLSAPLGLWLHHSDLYGHPPQISLSCLHIACSSALSLPRAYQNTRECMCQRNVTGPTCVI